MVSSQLQEYGSHNEAEALRSAAKLGAADVVLYVYDSSDTNSFTHISNLRQKHSASSTYGYLLSTTPCIFIATKADLDLAQQRHEVQPDVYCRKLELDIPGLGAGPLNVSVKEDQMAELFQRVVGIAVDSRGAVPGGRRGESALIALARRRWWLYILLGVACGTGGALWVAKKYGYGPGLGLGLFGKDDAAAGGEYSFVRPGRSGPGADGARAASFGRSSVTTGGGAGKSSWKGLLSRASNTEL